MRSAVALAMAVGLLCSGDWFTIVATISLVLLFARARRKFFLPIALLVVGDAATRRITEYGWRNELSLVFSKEELVNCVGGALAGRAAVRPPTQRPTSSSAAAPSIARTTGSKLCLWTQPVCQVFLLCARLLGSAARLGGSARHSSAVSSRQLGGSAALRRGGSGLGIRIFLSPPLFVCGGRSAAVCLCAFWRNSSVDEPPCSSLPFSRLFSSALAR